MDYFVIKLYLYLVFINTCSDKCKCTTNCGISAGISDWLGRGWYYNADIYGDHAGRVLSFSTVVKIHDGYYWIEKFK